MVAPRNRSRSKKKVKTRTPGGKTVTHYKGKKTGRKKCSRCSSELGGTPSRTKTVLRRMSKSERIPSRPYAGVLCDSCVDDLVRYVTRVEAPTISPELSSVNVSRDLTLEKYLPRGWYDTASSSKPKFRIRESKLKKSKPKKTEAKKDKAKKKIASKKKEKEAKE